MLSPASGHEKTPETPETPETTKTPETMIRPFSIHDPAFLARATESHGSGTLSWAARVVANGGAAPSETTLNALDVFWDALVAAGIDSKMKVVNIYAPDSLIACSTPYLVGTGSDPWTNIGPFTSSELTVDGLKGNGTSMAWNTGVLLETEFPAPSNSHGYTLYTFDALNQDKRDGGATDSGGVEQLHHLALSSTLLNYSTPSGTNVVSIANNLFAGYVCMMRVSSTDLEVYRANSGTAHALLGSYSGAKVGTLPAVRPFYVHGSNNVGTLAFPCSRRLSFMALHTHLTSGQSSDFFDAVQQLRTDLGGGYA